MVLLKRVLPLFCALCAAALVCAADPRIVLQADGDGTLYAGEPGRLKLLVIDFKTDVGAPQFPTIPGVSLKMTFQGESSSQSMVNGRVSRSVRKEFSLEVIATTAGEVTIPPITLDVDGKQRQSNSLRLRVKPNDSADYLFFEVSSPRKRLYVGQRIPLIMELWVALPVDDVLKYRIEHVRNALAVGDLGPFEAKITRTDTRKRANAKGRDLNYYVFEFPGVIVPDRPGVISFDRVDVRINYPTAEGTYRQMRAIAHSLLDEILPVPQEGRPSAYNGAVGMIDVETRASSRTVRVGDPIELRIELFGDTAIDSLPPPLLGEIPDLVRDFRIPDGALTGETVETRKVYTATIRPLRADVTQIPPIEYVMFDPDREKFVTMRSPAIPLTVSPSAELSAGSLTNIAAPTAPQNSDVAALDGLRDIRTDPSALLATTYLVTPAQILLIAAAPPAAFSAFWLVSFAVGLVSSDRHAARRKTAAKSAGERIRLAASAAPADRATQLRAALIAYLADRFDQPPGRVDGAAGIAFLQARSVRPEVVDEFAAVIASLDLAAFSGALTDADALSKRVLDLIVRLERA